MALLDICAYVPTCNATSHECAPDIWAALDLSPIPPRQKTPDGFSTATSNATYCHRYTDNNAIPLANATWEHLPCHVVQSCASDSLRSSQIHPLHSPVATTSGSRTSCLQKPSIAMFTCRILPDDTGAMCLDHWKRVGGRRREGWEWQSQAREWDHLGETLELFSVLEQDNPQRRMAGLGKHLVCNWTRRFPQ
jgi:hypothetical protein